MTGSVRKRGKKWYYSFEMASVEGKRNRIERVGGDTKKEAEIALRKALEEFERGGVIDNTNISVSDFLDDWYNDFVLLNCSHHTQQSRKTTINFLKEYLGKYHLRSLNSSNMQKFANDICKTDLAYSTLKLRFGVLKHALEYAVHPCKYIKSNPTNNIKLPRRREKKEKIHILTLKEYNKLIDSINNHQIRFKIAMQIAFHTGMRLSEICGLTWKNIDLNAKLIKVNCNLIYRNKQYYLEDPKTISSIREIDFGHTLLKILKDEKERQDELKKIYDEYYYKDTNNNDFVCSHDNGKPTIPATLKFFCIDKLSKQQGIKFNFHMLRHTHATMLLEAGAMIVDISKRLGHSQTSITLNIYSHVTTKMKKDTVDIFEKILK